MFDFLGLMSPHLSKQKKRSGSFSHKALNGHIVFHYKLSPTKLAPSPKGVSNTCSVIGLLSTIPFSPKNPGKNPVPHILAQPALFKKEKFIHIQDAHFLLMSPYPGFSETKWKQCWDETFLNLLSPFSPSPSPFLLTSPPSVKSFVLYFAGIYIFTHISTYFFLNCSSKYTKPVFWTHQAAAVHISLLPQANYFKRKSCQHFGWYTELSVFRFGI